MKAPANPVACAAALLFLTLGCDAGPAAKFDPAETCEGRAEGTPCWQRLASHPGCHVWNPSRKAGQTASWTGQCRGAVADGEGVLTWRDPDGANVYVVRRFANGDVYEIPYVNGQIHGTAVQRWPNSPIGRVSRSTPYVNGQKHGTEVERWTSLVAETPYVNGLRHGAGVWRDADGNVILETRWVDGEEQLLDP